MKEPTTRSDVDRAVFTFDLDDGETETEAHTLNNNTLGAWSGATLIWLIDFGAA